VVVVVVVVVVVGIQIDNKTHEQRTDVTWSKRTTRHVPVIMANTKHPREKMSDAGPCGLRRTTSGAMKFAVPQKVGLDLRVVTALFEDECSTSALE